MTPEERAQPAPVPAQLTDVLPDAVFGFDGDAHCIYANQAARRMVEEGVGLGPGEVLGRTWTRLGFVAEDEPGLEARGRRVAATGRTERVELSIAVLGRPQSYEITLSPLPDGEPPGVVAVLRGLTESKETESARQRLAAVVDATDDAVILNALDGTILSWNRGAEQVYGYTAAEAVGRSIAMVAPPGHEAEVGAILATIGRGGRVEHFETRRLRKDGAPVSVLLTVAPIRDRRGRIDGALTIARNTSERHSAEVRTRGLLEAAPDAIVVVDSDGIITMANTQAERLFGYAPASLVGQPVEVLVPVSSRAVHVAHRSEYAANPSTRAMGAGLELAGVRSDGTEFPAEISLSALQTDEGLLVSAAIRDATDRQRVQAEIRAAREEAEQANRAKSDFLSRMSHELRTPLNAILGFGQLLELEGPRPDQEESVRLLLRAGRHLLALIDEILDIARIEAGRLTLSLEPVPVEGVVAEALELVKPMATTSGVELRVVPGWLDAHAQVDRQRLKQVLLNLLSNAVKYNRRGGHVTVAWYPGGEGFVRIDVRDTGPGIREELMERLFLPFERLQALDSEVEGTGLGLALSRGLVEAMGGRVGAESRVGEGSTFWCQFPASSPSESDATGPETGDRSILAIPESQPGAKVLYVEDNLSNLRLVEQILAHRPGVQLVAAIQGSLALELAAEHRPDLLLLDLHLPDMSGEDVLRRWQADPATAAIPVIVISADATTHRAEQLIAGGASAYLTKPLDVRRFLEVLDSLLVASSGPPP